MLTDDFGVDIPHAATSKSREFVKRDSMNDMRVLITAFRSLYHYNELLVC